MNDMTAVTDQYLAPIFADLDKLISEASFNAIGGVLLAEDMPGLYRRVAQWHSCTPDDLRRWHEARKPRAK